MKSLQEALHSSDMSVNVYYKPINEELDQQSQLSQRD